jgi:hypothetical protein
LLCFQGAGQPGSDVEGLGPMIFDATRRRCIEGFEGEEEKGSSGPTRGRSAADATHPNQPKRNQSHT